MRHIIGFLVITAVITGLFVIVRPKAARKSSSQIDASAVALGKAVATAVHQALTDPYFAPLERLANFLARHPGQHEVSVDMLTKWAPDDRLPTCFVWQTNGSKLQLDHPTSPFVLEKLSVELRDALNKPNPGGQLYISAFKADEQRWWLGFLPIPIGSYIPIQMAGVFFSFEEYLNNDVPRLLDEFATRPRFPLVPFESELTGSQIARQGSIAFRILNADGEVFYRHGKTFDPTKMIYAESKYNPPPVIVALQKGWDLEVFDADYAPDIEPDSQSWRLWLWLLCALLVAGAMVWWMAKGK
ncbi:MAG: hypothetical protein FJY65_06715 [Calditrichaeota bacterium]|nr:hypothetical protein [Calditrichota bacterium]